MEHVIVVGAGIFGVTGALELRRRGHSVTLIDADTVPAPLAASTDITKVCRMEYGSDDVYMDLMAEAFHHWHSWNERWRNAGIGDLYHEVGVLMVRRQPMAPGDFEYESYHRLLRRGYAPIRLDSPGLVERFPAWAPNVHVDGFFNPRGGYAESGRVVAALVAEARDAGVTVLENHRLEALAIRAESARGVILHDGETLEAGQIVVATGAWTGKIVAELNDSLRASGHPVFHLKPSDPDLFRAERFPVFTADVSSTGYYGFPLTREGVVKVATHGVGQIMDPDSPRVVSDHEHEKLRSFLRECFPALADSEIVFTRLCLYSDTQDEDFWIARDPEVAGLTVAAGGSGHAFKFAPVLGSLIADAVEGKPHPVLEKFRWRPQLRLERGQESARCHDGEGSEATAG